MDVHEQGTAGVCNVGDMRSAARTAREPPDDPGFDRSEQGIAFFYPLARRLAVVEYPSQFGAGKISGQGKPCLLPEPVLSPVFCQSVAQFVCAGILPDNGVHVGLACLFVPYQCGFPLVCNADGFDVRALKAGFGKGATDHVSRVFPDFRGIVLHPARLREYLLVFLLGRSHAPSPPVEYDKAVAGRAQVQGPDVVTHARHLLCLNSWFDFSGIISQLPPEWHHAKSVALQQCFRKSQHALIAAYAVAMARPLPHFSRIQSWPESMEPAAKRSG
jgi:hypothetical protein